jgi:hypothetical protein
MLDFAFMVNETQKSNVTESERSWFHLSEGKTDMLAAA